MKNGRLTYEVTEMAKLLNSHVPSEWQISPNNKTSTIARPACHGAQVWKELKVMDFSTFAQLL